MIKSAYDTIPRLERESSNSLFDVLEEWDRVLQAENIDFAELSRIQENLLVSKGNTAESKRNMQSPPLKSQVKRQTQRFEP